MMRNLALSMGAMVVFAAVLTSSSVSATSSHPKPNNSNQNSNKSQLMVKREDGHTLTQKSLKVKNDKSSKARYHFNEIKDTNEELYLKTAKEDRHYHSNTKTTSTINGNKVVNKKVVVYNINKNKTICNIVEHSKNGTTKNDDCSNLITVKPQKEDCDEKEDNNTTPVVPNTDTNNEEVTETPKIVTVKEDPTTEEKPKDEKIDTQEVSSEGKGEETAQPESLPVTGASPVNGTLVALVAAIVTFMGYASALAFLEVRLKNQY